MSISGLNHYTIRCVPDDLPTLVAFYTKYVGLVAGERPTMPHPGYWLYANGHPIVHLYASLTEKAAGSTGPLDHVSFRAHGLAEIRSFLQADGTSFDEFPLPGTSINQIFLRDPNGLKIELTFDMNEEVAHGNAQRS